MAKRPLKIFRLNYWGDDDEGAHVTVFAEPNELRLAASKKSFIAIHEDKISISGGTPSKISIQGMSDSFVFGGMVQDLPWPMTMLPSTTYTPLPRQLIKPPFLPILPDIIEAAEMAAAFVA